MVVNKMDIAAYSTQFKFYASFLFMLESRCHHIRDIQENTRHNWRGEGEYWLEGECAARVK